ncbi:MAG: SAM-dependent methyltransferase [Alphaproteobacteria bacterium]
MEAHLRRLIAVDGPLPVSRYMGEVLTHPEHGYYARADAIEADFLTAPEASQMFGELVGLALAQFWLDAGQPGAVRLVELGPGRGTLMADLLRATARVPGFHDALDIHLVEASAALRQVQAMALAGWTPTWHDGLGTLPAGFWLLVGNEYLDALPVRQVKRLADGWHEMLVAGGNDGLHFVLSPGPLALEIEADEGTVVELGPAREAAVAAIAAHLARHGGCALLIDYGPDHGPPQATLQAIRGHARHEVLDAPGEADLSAHVDFAACAEAARQAGAAVHGPVLQGGWLRSLGIEARAAQLRQQAALGTVDRALDRLTAPAQMGTLFKALALTAPGAPTPAGFEGRP